MFERLSKINFSDFFKFGTATLLLAIPLYPKFPIANVPGTYVAIRTEDFLIFALAAGWIIYTVKYRRGQIFKDKINFAMLLFSLATLVSLASGIILTKIVVPQIGLLHWVRRIEYFLPFLVALEATSRARRLSFFVQTLFVTTFLVFVYGWGQVYANFPVISTQNAEYSKGIALHWIPGARLPSTFAGHYDLAAYLVLVFPIAIAYLFTLKSRKKQIGFFVFFLFPTFWLFLQTEARVSYVAYLIGVGTTLWFIKKKLFIPIFLLVSFIGLIFLSSLGTRYLQTIKIYKEKLIQNFSIVVYAQEGVVPQAPVEDRSVQIRLNIEWPRAIRAFEKSPLLGTGHSSITLATDSDYLRLLGEVGLLGLLAFANVITQLASGIRHVLKEASAIDLETAFIAGFLGSLVGFLINATFIDVFEASKGAIIFWTLAGIAVACVRNKLSDKQT